MLTATPIGGARRPRHDAGVQGTPSDQQRPARARTLSRLLLGWSAATPALYLGAAGRHCREDQMLGDARLAAEDGTDLVIGYLEPHGRVAPRSARAASNARHSCATARAVAPRASPATSGWSSAVRASRSSTSWPTRTPPARPAASATTSRRLARARHRRLDDRQHPASREPQQSHPRAHGRRGTRDVSRPLLHEADEIRLVDLSPRSLRERIGRGLVYPADRVDAALKGFFTVENLTALRALVLHELAEVAAAELQGPPRARPIERVLVAIGARRDSYAYLVRTGARLARRTDSELYVLAVEPQDGRVDARPRGDRRCRGAHPLARGRLPPPPSGQSRERDHPRGGRPAHHADRRRQEPALTVAHPLGGSLVEAVLRGTSGIDVHVVADPGQADR